MKLFALAIGIAAVMPAADFGTYRGFQFGMDLPSAAKQAKVPATEAKRTFSRPATIDELSWRVGSLLQQNATANDPAGDFVLRFVNGELFQIITNYDPRLVDGLSTADMVEVLSRTYGPSVPGAEIAYRSNYGETAKVLAQWSQAGHVYSLIRSGDQTSFTLIGTLTRLDQTAQAAIAEARRLDILEAPQRAAARDQQEQEALRAARGIAREKNKANFRP
jgi:hypothetical protein